MTDDTDTTDDTATEPDDEQLTWREPFFAFALVVVLLGALSALAAVWAPLSGHILAVAAVIFIAVPFIILRKKDADFHRFGIDLEKIPLRHVGLGLAVTAVIFPLYAVGHHVWETSVEQRQFEPSLDNYRQWPVDLNVPQIVEPDREMVQFRTVSNQLWVEWTGADPGEPTLETAADSEFTWTHVAGFSVDPSDDTHTTVSNQWTATPQTPGDARLMLSARGQPEDHRLPHRLQLQLQDYDVQAPPKVRVGAATHDADEPIELRRTHWWLVLWGLTHLLLVALPEEYFYRGYMQTRIADLFGDNDAEKPATFLGFTRANWLTSGVFAMGHILIPVGGAFSLARGAVFFPSLLFGWLRDRTGSIIAPTVFHAGANMMVLVAAVHYF